MITITCPGLDELKKKLEEKGKQMTKTYDEALAYLAEQAAENARAGFDEAQDYVHPDDWKKPLVKWDKVGDCHYIISANGEEVCFYEFGAGYTTDMYGFSGEMPFMVSPGSWSVKDKQQFTKYGRWYSPNGHYYNSIPPTRAMFNASQVLIRNLENGDFNK